MSEDKVQDKVVDKRLSQKKSEFSSDDSSFQAIYSQFKKDYSSDPGQGTIEHNIEQSKSNDRKKMSQKINTKMELKESKKVSSFNAQSLKSMSSQIQSAISFGKQSICGILGTPHKQTMINEKVVFTGLEKIHEPSPSHQFKHQKSQISVVNEKNFLQSYVSTNNSSNLYSLNSNPSDFLILSEQKRYVCPITNRLMMDPWITFCWHTFEKTAIALYIKNNRKCFVCQFPLSQAHFCQNIVMQAQIDDLRQREGYEGRWKDLG